MFCSLVSSVSVYSPALVPSSCATLSPTFVPTLLINEPMRPADVSAACSSSVGAAWVSEVDVDVQVASLVVSADVVVAPAGVVVAVLSSDVVVAAVGVVVLWVAAVAVGSAVEVGSVVSLAEVVSTCVVAAALAVVVFSASSAAFD
ncbi:hypothetical protein BD289DRAFT_440668 [Coniella lustricola]|uniref:Uncharacterized protein n=1 Tax=Coniella lustricola TaxID=2025994 RepID=A0A2T3A0A5_9PEZI|nr:hypothetical protein BD289DRAFT_440668 [Coniella lustricola]